MTIAVRSVDSPHAPRYRRARFRAWGVILIIASALVHSTRASADPSDIERATSALESLPGVRLLPIGELRETLERGVYVAPIEAEAIDVMAFQTKTGLTEPWHALVMLNDSSDFSFAPVYRALSDNILGDVSPRNVAFVICSADTKANSAKFPNGVRKLLSRFPGASDSIDLVKGVNIFADMRVGTTGFIGKANELFEVGDKPVLITGQVSAGTIEMVLHDAGVIGKDKEEGGQNEDSDEQSSRLALSVVLPEFTPFPYGLIGDQDRIDMRCRSTTFSITHESEGEQGNREQSFQITGAQEVSVWILGRQLDVQSEMNIEQQGDEFKLDLTGQLDANWKNAMGVDGMTIRSIHLAGQFDSATKGNKHNETGNIDVGVAVDFDGKDTLIGQLGLTRSGNKVTDLRLQLRPEKEGDGINLGALPGFDRVPAASEFEFKEFTLGIDPSQRDVYLRTAMHWKAKDITAEAAVLRKHITASREAFILFLKADGLNLRKLVPSLPPKAEAISLDHGMLAISSEDFSNLKGSDLPPVITEMMADVTTDLNRKMPVFKGVTAFAKMDPASASPEMKDAMSRLGLTESLIIAGSIGGLVDGRPSVALYADLPSLPVPRNSKQRLNLKLTSAGARLFLVAQRGGSGMELNFGIDGTVGLVVGDDELELEGSVFVQISKLAQGLRIAGKMNGTWDEPFQLQGIEFRDVLISGGVNADSSIQVAIGGTAHFGRFKYKMSGITSVITASGYPVPKTLGLKFEGSEISALTQYQIMGALVRGVAGGPLANTIKDSKTRNKVKQLAARDLAGTVEQTFPLPYLKFTNFALYLVTPGASFPDLPDLDGLGVGVKGTASFMNQRLVTADSFLTLADGLKVYTNPGDFDLGPGLTLTDAVLDIRVPMPGLDKTENAHFAITGHMGAGCSVVTGDLDVRFSRDLARFYAATAIAGYEMDIDAEANLKNWPKFAARGKAAKELARDIAESIGEEVEARVISAKEKADAKVAEVQAKLDMAQSKLTDARNKAFDALKQEAQIRVDDITNFARYKQRHYASNGRRAMSALWGKVGDAAEDIHIQNDGTLSGLENVKRKIDAVHEAIRRMRGSFADAVQGAINEIRGKIDLAVSAAKKTQSDVENQPAVVRVREAFDEARNAVESAKAEFRAETIDPIATKVRDALPTLTIDEVGFDAGLNALCDGRLPKLNVKGTFNGQPFDMQECFVLARKEEFREKNKQNFQMFLQRLTRK